MISKKFDSVDDCEIVMESDVRVERVNGDDRWVTGLVKFVIRSVIFCDVILLTVTVSKCPVIVNDSI